ncbi:MAG: TraR/DksA family transcriptional regulator [Candidatus Sulfotelmatobacter sp.]
MKTQQEMIKMHTSEIRRYKHILSTRLEQTIRALDRLHDETRSIDSDSPSDSADQCVLSLSRESLFRQSGERRAMVRKIEDALDRIKENIFGICIGCGDNINSRRLEALPWTQYCLDCQEDLERDETFKRQTGLHHREVALRKTG